MTVLIDLGDPRGTAEDADDGPRLSRTGRRVAALLTVVLAALLACAGSAPVPPAPLRWVTQLTAPLAAPVVFAGELVLVVHRGETTRDLVAVGNADGAERWRVRLDGRSTEVHEARQVGGTLLVSVLDSAAPSDAWTTYALDAATGARLWQEHAYLVGVAPRAGGQTVALVGMSPPVDWYGGWDVRTGRPLWRHTLDNSYWLAPYLADGQLAGMVLVEDDDRDRVRLVGLDGALGPLHEMPAQTAAVQVVGGLVVAAYERDGRRRVAALRLPALETAWDVAPSFGSRHVYLTECAPLVCASAADEVWLLDSADGAVRWQGRVGGFTPLGPGRVLTGTDDRPLAGALRDVATGDLLLRLDGWTPAGADGSRLVVTRTDGDRTWFGMVDLARPERVRLVGIGGITLDRCWLGGATLVCQSLVGLDLYRIAG
ncbi:outer membrane protein assembly factor BamB family protein [Catellatospora vulcania]|uniref:outer membrane protein assembly factor BamB family protein n=1 Tax=Catellatospora vulcania TaxID=1460450 RepID=UPI0018AFC422|nr:PQQ-binding-like beta-propeller repeat protein [Catellatospora vulcania]